MNKKISLYMMINIAVVVVTVVLSGFLYISKDRIYQTEILLELKPDTDSKLSSSALGGLSSLIGGGSSPLSRANLVETMMRSRPVISNSLTSIDENLLKTFEQLLSIKATGEEYEHKKHSTIIDNYVRTSYDLKSNLFKLQVLSNDAKFSDIFAQNIFNQTNLALANRDNLIAIQNVKQIESLISSTSLASDRDTLVSELEFWRLKEVKSSDPLNYRLIFVDSKNNPYKPVSPRLRNYAIVNFLIFMVLGTVYALRKYGN